MLEDMILSRLSKKFTGDPDYFRTLLYPPSGFRVASDRVIEVFWTWDQIVEVGFTESDSGITVRTLHSDPTTFPENCDTVEDWMTYFVEFPPNKTDWGTLANLFYHPKGLI